MHSHIPTITKYTQIPSLVNPWLTRLHIAPNTSKPYVAAHVCCGVQETQGSVEAPSSVGASGSSPSGGRARGPTGGRAKGPTGGSETAIAGAAATAVLSNAPASLHIRPKVADKVTATCARCVLHNNRYLCLSI